MNNVLLINPNSSTACTDGIATAIATLRRGTTLEISVIGSPDGPPEISSWQDWHAAVGPLCRLAAESEANVIVIACASDPGLEAVRAVTRVPVLGIFRCAVAAALVRAERFGVIALANASIERHALALRSMGVEQRLAGEVALNVPLEKLLEDDATTVDRLKKAARVLVTRRAGAIILGCTGLATYRAAIQEAVGVPVIDPCQAAVGAALAILTNYLPPFVAADGSTRATDGAAGTQAAPSFTMKELWRS